MFLVFLNSLAGSIDNLPIGADNFFYVGRFFHAPFHFKRGHACFHEFSHVFTVIKVLRTHNICFVFSIYNLTLAVNEFIRQTTRLGTSTPITAATADKTAHEALSGVTYTKCTVNKHFNFGFGFTANCLNLIKTHFTCQYNP